MYRTIVGIGLHPFQLNNDIICSHRGSIFTDKSIDGQTYGLFNSISIEYPNANDRSLEIRYNLESQNFSV